MARDPYEILGIARDATLREAMAAYKRVAELFHPDRLQGMRDDVQAEGAARMREATEAMRYLRGRLRRPLVARGHARPRDEVPAADRRHRAVVPAAEGGVAPGTVSPSDEATELEARLYDVELHAVEGRPLHARWGGPHAAATLAALRHSHRVEGGPIKQVEWGTYEALLEGDATRRLLEGVLPDADWREQPAIIVRLGDDERSRLPVQVDDEGHSIVPLRAIVDLIDDRVWYRVLADVY